MAAGLHTGLENKTYINTGSYVSPTATLLTFVKDVSIKLDRNFAEVKARISEWEMFLPVLKKIEIEMDVLADTSNTYWDVIRDAFINATMKEFFFSDQAIAVSGARYLRAQCYVSSFPIDQKLEEANMCKIGLKLAYHATIVPTWTNV